MTAFNHSSKFYVRSNLYSALRQFRKANEDINLWVDAVCINQDKNDPKALIEKTAQVARMHEVYSQADSVWVWLGEGTPQTKETFQFLKSILNLNTFEDLIKTKENPDKWYLLVQLMRNQWFSRRWVIQELALAREAVVYWGTSKMMWPDFADAIALAMTKYQEIKDILKLARKKCLIRQDVDIPEPRALGANTLVSASSNLFRRTDDGHIQQHLVDLEFLVSSLFLPFEASEPRDTIYAVLSLSRDTTAQTDMIHRLSWPKALHPPNRTIGSLFSALLSIFHYFLVPTHQDQAPALEEHCMDDRLVPNYGKSLTDVWADFMEYCIERSQSLDILCRPWAPPPRDLTWREALELEKAAFEIKSAQQNTNETSALKGTDAPSVPIELSRTVSKKFDGTLHVKGFKIDTVERATGRVLDGVIPVEGLKFGGWRKHPSTGEYPDRVPDILWRTLVADRDLDGMTAPTWYRRACLECLQHTNADGDLNTKDFKDLDDTPDTMKTFLNRMQAITWCRRFFLTKGKENQAHKSKPWYGLGPRDLAEGDLICILFGCSVPVVLRKVATTECYNFIGECYVHGMMDGESLPPRQRLPLSHPYANVGGFTLV
ncbi:uncharacterized protein LY89DRAFT_640877 [Mollisia scopiformis]|uniref:Heterokaryon incompatibility domain-containing protein n=1 Tax=Mollisia scopiformis TaxID=149040 RepID=A0A194XIV4_MOLSC|nr:uncharacterized protein LY89DRAFT_640877 [Mollisia scopiformis]KUJ19697.1 hypothetical protein LY89DRAFT_640877 [Mollisia scopiformis]